MRSITTAFWCVFHFLLSTTVSAWRHDKPESRGAFRTAQILLVTVGILLAVGCDFAETSSDSSQDSSSVSFRPYEAGLTGVWASASSIADIDGDGNQDLLIVGGVDRSPSATLYFGEGNGTFTTTAAGLVGVELYSSTSIADVNGDGHLDLFITGEDERNLPIPTLYLGNGDRTFTKTTAGLEGGEGGSSSIADLDGDGHLDLLITGRTDNQSVDTKIYLGHGDGTFSAKDAGLTDVEFGAHSIADVNGDGHLDILLTGSEFANDNKRIATLYLGDGSGGFSPANAGLTGVSLSSTSIADVNGDEHPDLLIAGYDGSAATTTLYLGDGNGAFSPANAELTDVVVAATAIADVDGDGHQDLVTSGLDSNEPGPAGLEKATTTLYLGTGNGDFSPANAGLTDLAEGSISIADIDGDQDLDLLITGRSENSPAGNSLLYEQSAQ